MWPARIRDDPPATDPGRCDARGEVRSRQDDVGAAERNAGPAAVTAGGQDLVHLQVAPFEAPRRDRHVEVPHAEPTLSGEGDARVTVGLEVGHPTAQRHPVVLPQVLEVADLEPGSLDQRDRSTDLVELAVRKDVSGAESPLVEPRLAT